MTAKRARDTASPETLHRQNTSPDSAGAAGKTRAGVMLIALEASLPELRIAGRHADLTASFPSAGVAKLRDLGVLAHFGGGAPQPLELMQALRLVGRADLSLGRIFEGHVNGAALIRWYGDTAQQDGLDRALSAGKVFGVWNSEQPPGLRLVSKSPGAPLYLMGGKTFATGAGFIDTAIVTAKPQTNDHVMVMAFAGDPARVAPGTWNVRGMRGTVSGAYNFTGLSVSSDLVVGRPGDYAREPRLSAGAWRFTAVQLGGIERVVGLLREHLAASNETDPVHRARFAEAVAEARSAYLWVREAAVRAGRATAEDTDVAPFVRLCRGVVERAALRCMEAATRCVGTRAFFEEHPLDQACRDLGLYLRQPAPDQAADKAAADFLARDRWKDDRLW